MTGPVRDTNDIPLILVFIFKVKKARARLENVHVQISNACHQGRVD